MSASSPRYIWLGDSIYQSFPDYQNAMNALIPSMQSLDQGCYPGNIHGGGFLDLADENYYYNGTAWVLARRPNPWSRYDGIMFEWGRNDSNPSNNVSSSSYQRGYDKLMAQARKYLGNVIPACCPPQCTVDFSAWDSANDNFINNGYYTAVQSVWSKYNAAYADHLANFKSLVPGTYSIAQLMRDQIHPTLYTGTATGIYQICSLLSNKISNVKALSNAAPTISGKVVNYWFGQPSTGSFTLTAQTTSYGTPLSRVAGLSDQALQSSTIGDVAKFPASAGSMIWLHFMNDSTGGTATAYVDRGLAGQLSTSFSCNLSSTGNTLRSVLLGDNLAAGQHMVEVQITGTGKVPLIGVTYVGA